MRKVSFVLITLLGAVMNIGAANADQDAEREALVRFISELDSLSTVIGHAQSQADASKGMTKFQYAHLRADIERIRRGVVTYLNYGSTAPRTLPPLTTKTDYENLLGSYLHVPQE